MGQLREPEAVVIAIVDDDPSVRRGLQRLIGSVGWKPETLSIFSVMPGETGNLRPHLRGCRTRPTSPVIGGRASSSLDFPWSEWQSFARTSSHWHCSSRDCGLQVVLVETSADRRFSDEPVLGHTNASCSTVRGLRPPLGWFPGRTGGHDFFRAPQRDGSNHGQEACDQKCARHPDGDGKCFSD